MKKKFHISSGVTCLLVILVIFGYMAAVMGLSNMLNTMMKTAHDLLLNTVFYLMGICVLTGALGKILVEFGAVELIQKVLRPIMKPIFNLPGVASLGAVLTFLSDNPAIISLSQDKRFARYFKKYQFISLTNFGTAFGMGLIVIVFMMSQGYMAEPFIGLVGAMCGCVISTRMMQRYIRKDYPEYLVENVLSDAELKQIEAEDEAEKENADKKKESTFTRILNSLLDGGKSGVEIGLAIIPGVLIISTLVMMLTFGGSTIGTNESGASIVAYTGAAYEGTKLLPWLASKVSFLFKWLFGFTAPELVSFPITALGAVGAALGIIPQFAEQGIIDGNAIAVFTAMGMCWSGYLSTHTAMLDSLGYRNLLSRAFASHFVGGLGAGVLAHWLYAGIMAIASLFSPNENWQITTQASDCMEKCYQVSMTSMDDGVYQLEDWFGTKGYDLMFTVNKADSTVNIKNAYAAKEGKYFFVYIDEKAYAGEPCYACLYPVDGYSRFEGDKEKGYFYTFVFVYDCNKRLLHRGYYEITWGGQHRWTEQEQEKYKELDKEIEEESTAAEETAVDDIKNDLNLDLLL